MKLQDTGKLLNEELHDLYSLPNIKLIMKDEMGRHVTCMGEKCMQMVGKPEGRRPLGRPRHSRDDSIEMNLKDTG
jgi:hypothetical protein